MIEYSHPKVEFFITTKAKLATEAVNEWLESHYEKDNIDVIDIKPFMSYTSFDAKGAGYMIGCMVLYLEMPEESKDLSIEQLDFAGESFIDPKVGVSACHDITE